MNLLWVGSFRLDTFNGAKPRFLNRGKKRHSVSTLSIPRASDRGVEWVDFLTDTFENIYRRCFYGNKGRRYLYPQFRRTDLQQSLGSDLNIRHDLKRERIMSLAQLYFLSKSETLTPLAFTHLANGILQSANVGQVGKAAVIRSPSTSGEGGSPAGFSPTSRPPGRNACTQYSCPRR